MTAFPVVQFGGMCFERCVGGLGVVRLSCGVGCCHRFCVACCGSRVFRVLGGDFCLVLDVFFM